ncbi:MAG: hypothetical protein WC371_00440 [Parachlamydiales bacterium]|jgi:hypothetical protein
MTFYPCLLPSEMNKALKLQAELEKSLKAYACDSLFPDLIDTINHQIIEFASQGGFLHGRVSLCAKTFHQINLPDDLLKTLNTLDKKEKQPALIFAYKLFFALGMSLKPQDCPTPIKDLLAQKVAKLALQGFFKPLHPPAPVKTQASNETLPFAIAIVVIFSVISSFLYYRKD